MFNWLKKKEPQSKTLGRIGEELAQLEYKQRGCKIIAANFFNRRGRRLGEIDFIARDKHRIIFVEVKTRAQAAGKFGSAAESVDYFKQIKLLKAVKSFQARNPKYTNLEQQIDVCVIIMTNFNQLALVETDPAKYLLNCPLDKLEHSATILVNAVEDWN
jgi:putative endonuclease